MKKDTKRILQTLVLLVASVCLYLLDGSHSTPVVPPVTNDAPSTVVVPGALQGETATVKRVVDGDTIVVLLAGEEKKVRVIGINTPETVDPRRAVQCFGKEASAEMKRLLPVGVTIELTPDAPQGDVDKYGRLLRYVIADGKDVGEALIRNGFASEYTYKLPYARQDIYQAAEVEARSNERGLWSSKLCPAK